MGHDFRPEYRNLKHIIKQLGDVPIIGLTATVTQKYRKIFLKLGYV
jgi:ATP-dependent DNA helicase RecQ